MEMKSIERLVPMYVQVLKEGNPNEIYKWRALKNFKQNWSIESEDFGAMFDASLQAESGNLFASRNYFPRLPNQLRNDLFEHFAEVKRPTSETERYLSIARTYSWWQIAGAALLDPRASSVSDLSSHPLIQAKGTASQQQNMQAMLWAMLQQYTVEECENVRYSKRAEPLFFYKERDSRSPVVEERLQTSQKPESKIGDVQRGLR